jgi:hypothetical protein
MASPEFLFHIGAQLNMKEFLQLSHSLYVFFSHSLLMFAPIFVNERVPGTKNVSLQLLCAQKCSLG